MQLWDRGYWAPERGFEDVDKALKKGELKFVMEGERVHGGWVIVRIKGKESGKPNHAWLLIKHRDQGAAEDAEPAVNDRSVASGRTMAEIAAGAGRPAKPFMTAKSSVAKPRRHAVATLPAFIEPQLARSLEKPPSGPTWVHEIKMCIRDSHQTARPGHGSWTFHDLRIRAPIGRADPNLYRAR